MDPGQIESVGAHGARYRAMIPDLPASFTPLRDGDRLTIGKRRFSVLELPGHAPAQIVLHEPDENLLLIADHVLTRISPNISVTDLSPEDDPLGRYVASLKRLRTTIPDGGLVLPGHHLPFRTLHGRTRELETHHHDRCALLEEAVIRDDGSSAADLVPVLFPFRLDAHQFWFAFSETLAHLNHLARLGRLEATAKSGIRRWRRAA